MFHWDWDRPSDRRKLFLVLVLIFSIVVYGSKFMVVRLGWMEEKEVEDVPEEPPPVFSSPPSNQDREEARIVAEEFIKTYISSDLKESKSLMTSDLYASEMRDQEASRIDPAAVDRNLSVIKTHSSIIQDYYLEEQGKVKITVWATIKADKDSYEVPYWITLNRDMGRWLVEGVELGDYPEGE